MDSLWPEWHKEAECLGVIDDVLFFGSPKTEDYTPTAIKKAQHLCDVCPVFTQCLRHALTEREPWGIWASTTIRERQVIFDGIDAALFTLPEIIEDRLEARDERARRYH